MIFFLGVPEPSWLSHLGVPLFVSYNRLRRIKHKFPTARSIWALDSGGFTQLQTYGTWTVGAREYASDVRFWREEIGNLVWAATQDWMCEPEQVKRTGLSVAEHQRRTVRSYLDLQQIAPDLPWMPVLQGYTPEEYLRCIELYYDHGVDLCGLPTVGIGSVCRRQGTTEIADLVSMVADLGLKLHGFGVKSLGLDRFADRLVSSDSMAWSKAARYSPPMRGHSHQTCANCPEYAMRWYAGIVRGLPVGIDVKPAPKDTSICESFDCPRRVWAPESLRREDRTHRIVQFDGEDRPMLEACARLRRARDPGLGRPVLHGSITMPWAGSLGHWVGSFDTPLRDLTGLRPYLFSEDKLARAKDRYARRLAMDPIRIVVTRSGHVYLSDGNHRLIAARELNLPTIRTEWIGY